MEDIIMLILLASYAFLMGFMTRDWTLQARYKRRERLERERLIDEIIKKNRLDGK